jgi:hypothetical protein
VAIQCTLKHAGLLADHCISGGLTAVAQHESICEPFEFEAMIRGALDPSLNFVLIDALIHAVTQDEVSALSFLPVFSVVAVGVVIRIYDWRRTIQDDAPRESTQNRYLAHRFKP